MDIDPGRNIEGWIQVRVALPGHQGVELVFGDADAGVDYREIQPIEPRAGLPVREF